MSQKFEFYPFSEGMRVQMKKLHPCGGDLWVILRVGAEVKLQCERCKHTLALPRRKLEQACKQVLPPPGAL